MERIQAAVDLEEADRIPILPLVSYALSDLISCTMFDYCHNAHKLSDAIIAGYHKFKYDAVIAFADVYLFAEAAGLPLEFPANNVPQPLASPIKSLEDVERLEIPDVKKDGRLPMLLEAIERTSKKLPHDVPIYTGGLGPFTLSAQIRGLEPFLKDLYMNRSLAEKLIQFCTKYLIELGEAELEAGAHITHLGESFAGPSITSPKFFKELSLPYVRHIFEKWKSFGAITSIHMCGETSLIWPLIAETKTDIFEIDYMVDLEKAKQFFKDKLCLMGNIDPSGIIYHGSVEDNRKAALGCIEKCATEGGYILGSGCLIMPGFPHQNLEAIVNTAKEYGKYS